MSLPLAFHPDVRDEIDDAYRWYEQERTGLGEDFLTALDEVFRRIERMPAIHQVIWRDVRRALPRRFPYGVFYRIQPNQVEVIAVQHSRRDPSRWRSRA